MKLLTYKPSATDIRSASEWERFEWRPGEKLYNSPWQAGINPYAKGQKLDFSRASGWSFGCGSVFNWIDNVPYGKIHWDRSNLDTYILRSSKKCCAGREVKKRDVLVDGPWFYYIKKLKTKYHPGDPSTFSISFVINSDPYDLPAIVRENHIQSTKFYYGEMDIGDFSVRISHKDRVKRRWISKKQMSKIQKELGKILATSLENPEIFI